MWKKEKTHQKICWILFFSYLLMLTYFMFFSDGFGRSEYTEYHYNLTLFKEIRRFYTYRELVGTKAFLLNAFWLYSSHYYKAGREMAQHAAFKLSFDSLH